MLVHTGCVAHPVPSLEPKCYPFGARKPCLGRAVHSWQGCSDLCFINRRNRINPTAESICDRGKQQEAGESFGTVVATAALAGCSSNYNSANFSDMPIKTNIKAVENYQVQVTY